MLVRVLRRLLMGIGVPILVIVLGLGYLGFIPGVSAMFGSNKPVDLGLPADESDRQFANQKFQQTILEAGSTPGIDIIRSGPTNHIDTTLTPQESAAHLMQMHPFTDLQIRFNADGSFEAAGKIDTPRIAKYLSALNLTTVNGVDVLKTVDRYLTGRPTIYVHGTGSVTNDQVTLNLKSAKLGRLPLATEQFGQGLKAYVEAVMKHVPGLDVDSMTVESGQVHFVGEVPSTFPEY